MSNVISKLRASIREDGAAFLDAGDYNELQEQWIRRTLGEDVLAQMKEELAAADARAGKAERELESERFASRARAEWLVRAKREAGFNPSVSFDVVWKEALAALKEKRMREGEPCPK